VPRCAKEYAHVVKALALGPNFLKNCFNLASFPSFGFVFPLPSFFDVFLVGWKLKIIVGFF
jgi:hypothetical protein